MQEFFSGMGMDEDMFTYVVMPLLIFLARVGDVTINTLRIMFVLNGKKKCCSHLRFF